MPQKRSLAIVCVGALLLGAGPAVKDCPQGTFVGLREIGDMGDGDKWYHESTLTITDNRVRHVMVPVHFNGTEKFYSASDGGFMTWEGTCTFEQDQHVLHLLLVDYDYIGAPYGPNVVHLVMSVQKDELIVDNVKYSRQ